jgi:hypothetical protein
MLRRLSCSIAVVLSLLVGPAVQAQTDAPADLSAPAHISVVQGSAVLERNGVGEPASENLPLLQGDRVRTESGRLEIILPDGSILDLDRQTTVDLLAGGLVRLMGGRMVFVLSVAPGGEVRRDYQVDAPAGSVRFTHAGEYRISANVSNGTPFLEVSVVRGRAVVDADGRTVPLSAGERAQATQGQGVTAVGSFNSALADAFLEWSEMLRGQRVGMYSTAYLPPELQVYGGTFDRDGSWENSGEYGPVWYPRVESEWRPYYDGGWYPYGWGWTWVGAGRWTWPTHHYGRWGHGNRGWYWIPSAGWGPAWVSWGFSTDYVSWCPLGWNNSAVFGFSFGISIGYPSPWLGWTAVPHHAFGGGHGYRVQPYAVRGEHLRAVERARFDVRRSGPPVPGSAVGRGDGGARVTPYDRAQAVAAQRVGSNPGWAQSQGMTRGSAALRTDAAASRSSIGRPLPAAPQGPGGLAAAASPGTAARGNAARTWTAGSTASYDRAQGTAGERTPSLGAVPRSQTSRPSESRSPYYYLGPSEARPSQVPPAGASPRTPSGPGGSAVPRSYREPGSSSPSPASTWPSASEPSSGQGGMADPRSRSYSSPYPSPYSSSPSSAAPRTYSTPDRSSESRPSAGSGYPSGGGGRTSSGASAPASGSSGARSAGAPSGRPSGGSPSGVSGGGRTPGRAPSGGSGGGGGARGGGGGGRGGRGR